MPYPYHIDDLLKVLNERSGSDLHVRAHEPPIFRIHGDLERTDFPVLSPEDTKELLYSIMTPEQQARYEQEWEFDMAYELPGLARFRVNVFRQQHCVGALLRLIPVNVLTVDELGLLGPYPDVFRDISSLPRGLVLVTGPTGCGKTTTLAAMVHYINDNRRAHIVTIEEPIEFVHPDKKSVIQQRQVGIDTTSFAEALRHCMRQNPDVILVGELRDLETISLAITAAETGHLVFATLHTTDAAQTVDRAIDVFPPAQQAQIRMQLAICLQAVMCQTLLPLKDRPGRIPAFEIMRCEPSIRSLIREGKTHQIPNSILSGFEIGMINLDTYLARLVKEGLVTFDQALLRSQDPGDFARRCGVSAEEAAAAA